MAVKQGSTYNRRDGRVALTIMPSNAPKPKHRVGREEAFLRTLAVPLPLIAIVRALTVLCDLAARAVTHRLRSRRPPDRGDRAIVTGRRADRRAVVNTAEIDCGSLSLTDLAIAVRSDRTYGACLAELRLL